MTNSPNPKNSVSNAVKLYLFPSLVSILAMMIWRDVSELRSDVKQLLAQSNVDKTEIQNLKRDVQMLNHQVFKTPIASAVEWPSDKKDSDFPKELAYNHLYFIHEESFDVNKYIPKF